MENAAEQLRTALGDFYDKGRLKEFAGMEAADVLAVACEEPDRVKCAWEIWSLSQRVMREIGGYSAVGTSAHYFLWVDDVKALVHGKESTADVRSVVERFRPSGVCWATLSICADVIRVHGAKGFEQAELDELAEAATALRTEFETTIAIDEKTRIELIHTVNIISEAINEYKKNGAIGLRAAIERFLGRVALNTVQFGDFATSDKKGGASLKRLLDLLIKGLAKVRPSAEGVGAIADAGQKLIEILSAV